MIVLEELNVARHECWNCRMVLGCIDTAHYVICPTCRCVMLTAVSDNGSGTQTFDQDHATPASSASATEEPCVGLVFCYNEYEIIVSSTKTSVQALPA